MTYTIPAAFYEFALLSSQLACFVTLKKLPYCCCGRGFLCWKRGEVCACLW